MLYAISVIATDTYLKHSFFVLNLPLHIVTIRFWCSEISSILNYRITPMKQKISWNRHRKVKHKLRIFRVLNLTYYFWVKRTTNFDSSSVSLNIERKRKFNSPHRCTLKRRRKKKKKKKNTIRLWSELLINVK